MFQLGSVEILLRCVDGLRVTITRHIYTWFAITLPRFFSTLRRLGISLILKLKLPLQFHIVRLVELDLSFFFYNNVQFLHNSEIYFIVIG